MAPWSINCFILFTDIRNLLQSLWKNAEALCPGAFCFCIREEDVLRRFAGRWEAVANPIKLYLDRKDINLYTSIRRCFLVIDHASSFLYAVVRGNIFFV